MQNLNPININMFDAVGVFKLSDDKDVSDLVGKLEDGVFLSRSYAYYKQRTVLEFREFREELKKRLLTVTDPIKQFVIAEHMLTCSARVAYNELTSARPDYMAECKICLVDDAKVLVDLFEGKQIEVPKSELPKRMDVVNAKVLECDNKALIYAFCKCQNLALDCFVVTPGFGSILIGPFFKNIKNFDFEMVDFSIHKKSIMDFNIRKYPAILNAINNKKTLLLLDDNVVSGRTLTDLKLILSRNGANVLSGAVQFDWQNYYEQSKHKLDLYRFKLNMLNIVTLTSFFGENFLENAKACLIKKPSLYVELISAYGMGKPTNDIIEMFELGEKFATKSKINLDKPAKGDSEGLNDYSIKLNADLKKMFS